MHSLSMDPAWNDSVMKVDLYLREAVSRIFSQEEPLCLVMPKGNRFVAASLLDPSAEDFGHLVSGPAVLVEYRNRGIGSRLLHASLLALKERGLDVASGVTRVNTIASRYVYPKYGGVAESIQLPSQAERLFEN
jgi:ribosomal protein S18 acetylase RimI-like enzyme